MLTALKKRLAYRRRGVLAAHARAEIETDGPRRARGSRHCPAQPPARKYRSVDRLDDPTGSSPIMHAPVPPSSFTIRLGSGVEQKGIDHARSVPPRRRIGVGHMEHLHDLHLRQRATHDKMSHLVTRSTIAPCSCRSDGHVDDRVARISLSTGMSPPRRHGGGNLGDERIIDDPGPLGIGPTRPSAEARQSLPDALPRPT